MQRPSRQMQSRAAGAPQLRAPSLIGPRHLVFSDENTAHRQNPMAGVQNITEGINTWGAGLRMLRPSRQMQSRAAGAPQLRAPRLIGPRHLVFSDENTAHRQNPMAGVQNITEGINTWGAGLRMLRPSRQMQPRAAGAPQLRAPRLIGPRHLVFSDENTAHRQNPMAGVQNITEGINTLGTGDTLVSLGRGAIRGQRQINIKHFRIPRPESALGKVGKQAEYSSSNEISFPMAARRETTPMTSSPSSSASGPSQINQVLPNTAKKSPETNKTATQDKWILQNNYTWETIEGTPNSLLVETTKQLKEAENSVISLRQQLHINDNNFSCMRDQIEQCIENNLQCNICYEMFIEPTVLNCSHTFCLECIESWTREANHCPTCRAIVINKSHCRTLDTYLDKISEYLSSEIKTRRESLKVERNNNKVEVNRNPRNNARINHRHQVITLALGADLWNELNQIAAERGITPEEALLDPILMGDVISRYRNNGLLASHLDR